MSLRSTDAQILRLCQDPAHEGALPSWIDRWVGDLATEMHATADADLVLAAARRARPRAIVIDGRGETWWREQALAACDRLKRDPFTGLIPVVCLVAAEGRDAAFAAGADEVLVESIEPCEAHARLAALIRRSDRDTDVHPSTRLPGARAIEAELERRIRSGEKFAACYTDLDHFKEFNDRYGYNQGDGVIRLVARLLHDVVSGWCGEDGFVGHIGGDDFLYTVPLGAMAQVCDDIVELFDELSPWQYSDQDRRVGYFFGKDRRGQLHRVPLMTVSIGVVTNQRRHFTRAVEVSELATEMKSYAKTLAGSVWAVDRRNDEPAASVTSVRSGTRTAGGR